VSRSRLKELAPDAVLAVVLFVMARTVQQSGHGWGDDFALYINQARGLLEGTAAEVVANNRFSMDNSAFPAFTPIAYPWGTSLLLLPIVIVFGINYSMLKLVPTLAFVASVFLYRRIADRRFGRFAVVAVTLTVAFNPWYIWATDAVLSDLPFMATVFAALVAIDRAVERGTLLAGRHPDALVAGALIAAAFHIRREGLGLLLAVAAAQFALWRYRQRTDLPSEPHDGPTGWSAMAGPWLSFAVVGGVGHLLFPAPIRGNVDVAGDPGLSQVEPNLIWYRESFAELVGLKRIGDEPVQAFGVHWLGTTLLWTLLLAAIAAAIWAIGRAVAGRGSIDVSIVGAVVGMGLIVMMTPYHYQRYLMTLAPLVLLLAVRGIAQLIGLVRSWDRGGWAPQLAVSLVLLAPLALHIDVTTNSLRFHSAVDYVHRGPEDRPTQELWNAVRRYTDGRDVVVFFQARSMTFYTRRLSIVGNNEQMMVERGDWYAMERDSDYLQTPLTDERAAELGFVRVWQNDRYVLWDIPPPPPPVAVDPLPGS
jgi:hypothetical protein